MHLFLGTQSKRGGARRAPTKRVIFESWHNTSWLWIFSSLLLSIPSRGTHYNIKVWGVFSNGRKLWHSWNKTFWPFTIDSLTVRTSLLLTCRASCSHYSTYKQSLRQHWFSTYSVFWGAFFDPPPPWALSNKVFILWPDHPLTQDGCVLNQCPLTQRAKHATLLTSKREGIKYVYSHYHY